MATYEEITKLQRDAQAAGMYDASPEFLASLLGITPAEMQATLKGGPGSAAKTLGTEASGQGGDQPAGEGRGGPSSSMTGESGPLSGGLKGGMQAANMAGGLLGQFGALGPAAAFGPLGPLGATLTASKIAEMLGAKPSFDIGYSMEDVEGVRDQLGAFAAEAASERNAGKLAGYNKSVAEDETGYADYSSGKPTPGGFVGGQAPGLSEGMQNPDAPLGGWSGLSGLGTSGGEGRSSSEGTSSSDAAAGASPGASGGMGGSSGGGEAEGGVRRASGKSKTSTYGEDPKDTGETAIFVPDDMKRGKKLKNKKKVMHGLATELQELGHGTMLEEIMEEALAFIDGKER